MIIHSSPGMPEPVPLVTFKPPFVVLGVILPLEALEEAAVGIQAVVAGVAVELASRVVEGVILVLVPFILFGAARV